MKDYIHHHLPSNEIHMFQLLYKQDICIIFILVDQREYLRRRDLENKAYFFNLKGRTHTILCG